MIIPFIYGKTKNVPNHQPEIVTNWISSTLLRRESKWLDPLGVRQWMACPRGSIDRSGADSCSFPQQKVWNGWNIINHLIINIINISATSHINIINIIITFSVFTHQHHQSKYPAGIKGWSVPSTEHGTAWPTPDSTGFNQTKSSYVSSSPSQSWESILWNHQPMHGSWCSGVTYSNIKIRSWTLITFHVCMGSDSHITLQYINPPF